MAATALKAITATPMIFHSLVPEDAVELFGSDEGDVVLEEEEDVCEGADCALEVGWVVEVGEAVAEDEVPVDIVIESAAFVFFLPSSASIGGSSARPGTEVGVVDAAVE